MRSILRTIKHWLEYAGFRLVAAIIRALPVETASSLLGFIWRKLAPLSSRHKRALDAIAQSFPDKDRRWHEARINEMWDNLGRVFAESFHLERIVSNGWVVAEGIPEILAELADPPQLVAVTLHLGNWELASSSSLQTGISICGIYQRIHNPLIEKYIYALREPLYPAGLFPKRQDAGRSVIRAIKNGASLGTLGDLREWGGPDIDFFGRPAPTNTFPALIARSMDIPFYAARIARVPENGNNVRFSVKLERIQVPRTDDRAADVLAATKESHARFEAFIREYPGQWMWAHRRWG